MEGKYEDLRSEHDRMREETEERTNVRISYIEEEIESMNKRVEKLATDSYAIHSEVRDIHESVIEMQHSLRDIVQLYKAILTKYGFANVPPRTHEAVAKGPAGKGGEPGDEIVEALRREQEARQGRSTGVGASKRSQTVPPKAKARETPPKATSGRSTSLPSTTDALDELHRLSEAKRGTDREEVESLAERLTSRSSTDDRLGKVARRDMGKARAIDRASEGEFTRSLPKKSIGPIQEAPPPTEDDGEGWEATEPPPGTADRGRRKGSKPRLEDLLSPE